MSKTTVLNCLLGLTLVPAGASWVAAEKIEPNREITVRGRVVCLDASAEPVECGRLDNPSRFGLRDEQGRLYMFSEADSRTVMLTDPRVRARELEIIGWLDSESRLEIVKLYSVRDGVLYDIYYRCETCNITAFTPGACWCCQKDFELKEVVHRKR